MTLGQQITTLRKKKGLSQADLGKLVETSGDIIGRYERDEVKPSIEVVVRMADALEVSLDFLVGKSDLELDKKTIKRLEDIEKLPDNDKEHIFYALDGLIKAAKLNAL
ncbi:helix-turn-helix domain-containing protein [Pedobacter cryophilus]|uniref:Helix-turn-helix domain-containing protein n=1 Tax=Pedobacter cryophilus TaxID=2571271 RepID=A0A4U1C0P3_9SPHI|nr:helix-turn-helix transcriptional regulator [Pedobacter cryophilus]TKB99092.1 helix-turn-helix domain-containing protein [Pedobacter cryophilus]